MTAKETVRAVLERLPDNCSIDDVLYQLYVVQAVALGPELNQADLRELYRVRPEEVIVVAYPAAQFRHYSVATGDL